MYTNEQISAYHHRRAQAHYSDWRARAETNKKRALAIKALNKFKAIFRGKRLRNFYGLPHRKNYLRVFKGGKRRRLSFKRNGL